MQRKKLPIGIQTFRDIRDPQDNWIYVDKSKMAYDLIHGGKYYFLSRPRRFGKSLFLDTLSEVFKGSKHLFEGLYIYDKWDWEQQYPVVKIDFTGGDFSTESGVNEVLKYSLLSVAEKYGIESKDIESGSLGVTFKLLIKKIQEKHNQKVVILIDEYDKPILDNIGKEDQTASIQARDILKNFYSAIKASDEYLKLVFITGVSKFSKLNLFSGLNNLEDITIDERYATITGYTQADLEREFAEYLDGVDLQTVKKWYNGYNYFGEPVYNPFDILLFFSKNCEFRNFWWETGNPSFLIEKLKEGNYFLPNLENIEVGEETLNAFDVEYIDLVALLWQTGYLTFDKKVQVLDDVSYKLKVPNLEIQKSLNALFFNYLTDVRQGSVTGKLNTTRAMLASDMEAFKNCLHSMFAAIPYNNFIQNNIAQYEGYYASVMYAYMCSLGFLVKTEDYTSKGRIDMTLIGPGQIFILEFKVDAPEEAALQQIEEKKYYEKYQSEGKKIILVGIHFSSEERNISEMEWKEL